MKFLLIGFIRIIGIVFIIACPMSLINHYFDWGLAVKGEEVPSDPRFAVSILILGVLLSLVGWILNKKYVE